ncbi:MAG TPA: phosphotransferase [Microlunatus sp.]|nr:phosphotransferase [Microlunatus sp.]
MAAAAGRLPDLRTLNHRLRVALDDEGVVVLDRRPDVYATSSPTEVLACRLTDQEEVRLFCKYDLGTRDGSHGHRLGVAYEAEVYRELLVATGVSTPRFYGAWTDTTGKEAFLVIEYLDGAHRLDQSHDSSRSMVRAATWLAEFQRLVARRGLELPRSSARRLGRDYYLGWSRRAAEYASRSGLHAAELELVRAGFERSLDLLTGGDLVPVHGELYPDNVLVHRERIRPIDWESAAVAVGEIDLASLVEGWGPDVSDACCAAYAGVRWPDGPPPDFTSRLDMARAYLHFRWIADGSSAPDRIRSAWRARQLRSIGARLGFLPVS